MVSSLIIDNIEYQFGVDWENERVKIHIPYAISETDDQSKKDFFITNDLLCDGNGYFFRIPDLRTLRETRDYLDSFWDGKAYDAYLFLRDKIADGLVTPHVEFNTGLKFQYELEPAKYLDESTGKLMQTKSLNGWQDVQVKYAIAKYSKFSFDPMNDFVVQDWDKNKNVSIYRENSYMFTSCFLENQSILLFDSADKANEVLLEVKQKYHDNLIKGGMSISRALDKMDGQIWSVKQVIL